jgi:hypothetical protein
MHSANREIKAQLAPARRRAQDKILRRGDFFFVALVCFCKPLRAKEKATKETKGGDHEMEQEQTEVAEFFQGQYPAARVR